MAESLYHHTEDLRNKTGICTMIADICQELAMWCADSVCGIDGKPLSDLCLRRRGMSDDCSPATLLRNFKELGMSCSKFMFCHCDLYSVNIIVNTPDSSLGLIDWETADCLTREWIRTKFRVSGSPDLPGLIVIPDEVQKTRPEALGEARFS